MAIPLSVIFAIQSIIVVVAFGVVIWLLTDQQHKDLQEAIFNNIDQRQQVAVSKILEPFVKYETPVERLADRLKVFPALRCGENSTHASITEYLNTVVLDVTDDSFVRFISQFHEERNFRQDDGNPAWGGCTLSPTYVNIAGRNVQNQMFIVNELPISFDRLQTSPSNYAASTTVGHLRNKTYPNWTPAEMFPNPNKHGEPELYISYNYPLEFAYNVQTTEPTIAGDVGGRNITTWGIVLDLTMSSVGEVAADAKIAKGSKVMLYEMNRQQLLATSESIALLNANQPWNMYETPDREMNAAAKEAMGKCPNEGDFPCESLTYLTSDSVISVHYLKTASDINMMLLQVTPETYFFGDSRKTQLNGILVGAGAAVIVVITCVIIWLAVYRPLNTLQDNMELAANMQNERAEANACFLHEIAVLNHTFEKMNSKLLQARAFMPQALLVGNRIQDDDEDGFSGSANDDDEEEEEEGPLNYLSSGNEDDEGALSTGEPPASEALGRLRNSHTAADAKEEKDRRNHNQNRRHVSAGDNKSVWSDKNSVKSKAKHGKQQKYTLTLSRAITNRRIGILVVNGRGFHRLCAEASLDGGAVGGHVGPNGHPTSLNHMHQAIVELVEGSSKAEKGVVDTFQGDHFVISFNAAIPVGAPAKGAALCALRIQNSVATRTRLPGVTMGMSTGMAMVGSLGSSEMKKFCMITPAFSQAVELELAAKQVIGVASCLFSAKISGDLDMHVYSQIVGQKYLCGSNLNMPEGKVVNVAGVMGAITTQGDEWLYELEEGASKNPYTKINAAFEVFFAGRPDVCAEILQQGYPAGSDPGMVANWHRLSEIITTGSNAWQL